MRMALILKLLDEAKNVNGQNEILEEKLLTNEMKCQNPKCITSEERGLKHVFKPAGEGTYRCVYCEQKVGRG